MVVGRAVSREGLGTIGSIFNIANIGIPQIQYSVNSVLSIIGIQ